ncbi:MAG: DNA recombination protein RmuC [Dehalococcoidia bacterium]
MDMLIASFITIGLFCLIVFLGIWNSKLKKDRRKEYQEITESVIKEQLGNAFPEAVNKSSDYLIKLNQQHMESLTKDFEQKRNHIEKSMDRVFGSIQNLTTSTGELGSKITTEIKNVGEQANELRNTTEHLNNLLDNNPKRGQWGERVTEDILRSLGFVEGIGYEKQQSYQGQDGGTRPDYEFPLPGGLKVYMDVKFPFTAYEEYFNEESKSKKEEHRKRFLQDVERKIKTLPKYINIAQGTVDYVFMFIPNEAVMSFLYESDQNLFERALQQRVLLLSPITLYSALATIRHILDTIKIKQSANEITELMSVFDAEWGKFKSQYDRLGKQIQTLQNTYSDDLSRRVRMLEKPLDKINELKSEIYLSRPENIVEDSLTSQKDED